MALANGTESKNTFFPAQTSIHSLQACPCLLADISRGAFLLAGYSQPLASLGTTRIDHGATTGGFHTGAKTVGSGPFNFTGLVGSFHGILSV